MSNPQILSYKNGEKAEYWYDENGHLHREKAPAQISYLPDGSRIEKWYWHGKIHNRRDPAVKEHNKDGILTYKAWYRHGEILAAASYNPETGELMLFYYHLRRGRYKRTIYRKYRNKRQPYKNILIQK